MSLGLCVIGCGDFARTFSRAIQDELAEIDLYFASRDSSRAASFAAEFRGADSFGSYESAVGDSRVDAVYICTPHYLHLEHARLAAGAGKHILLEKPLARTREEAHAIVSVAEEAGVTLMVAENYRFMPPVVAAKQAVDEGIMGSLRLIQLQEDFPFRPAEWRNDADLNGGGVFIDGGIHKASLLAYLAGCPSEVYAAEVPSAQPGLAAEDGVIAMLRYPNGLVGVINHTWSAGPHNERPWVTVSGSIASIAFELGGDWLDTIDSSGRHRQVLGSDRAGLAGMVREFRNSIQQGRPPAMTGEEGARDVSIVEACYRSMRTGQPVNFPESPHYPDSRFLNTKVPHQRTRHFIACLPNGLALSAGSSQRTR